jgi:hypothetical protein
MRAELFVPRHYVLRHRKEGLTKLGVTEIGSDAIPRMKSMRLLGKPVWRDLEPIWIIYGHPSPLGIEKLVKYELRKKGYANYSVDKRGRENTQHEWFTCAPEVVCAEFINVISNFGNLHGHYQNPDLIMADTIEWLLPRLCDGNPNQWIDRHGFRVQDLDNPRIPPRKTAAVRRAIIADWEQWPRKTVSWSGPEDFVQDA